ncbi:DUF1214 domain-containing protein [Streptomyces sp. NPDC005281]|uniref:DUF1214 domain-containing protein n=1 Tax=Streptomyces sp. NPDC005281 TaxID=3155712 RepID=UPI0033AC084F
MAWVRRGRRGQGEALDILNSHRHPGAERERNWLPAPAGPLGVTLRLYAPRPEALNGQWQPPVVHKV